MNENDAAESEFWSRVPDSRLDRFRSRHPRPTGPKPVRSAARPAGSRAHQDPLTGSVPVVAAPVADRVRSATGQVDPLLRRVGVLAIVVALLVPVALSLRSESGAQRTAAASPGLVVPEVGAADTGVPADAVAAPVEAADPFAAIDVNALPPAVPAHPDTTAKRTKAATTTDESTTAAAASTTGSTKAATTNAVTRSAQSASTQRATVCSKRYTIRGGDAWISIAQRARVTLTALLAANGATSSTSLYPGRSICLPAGARTPAVSTSSSSSSSSSSSAKPTTPTTTKPKPGPVYTPPTTTYTKDQVRQIIRDVWPDSLEDEAIRIATRESNLVPGVKNYCCYGLFQIYWGVHRQWLASIGITSAAMLWDPRVNAYAAYVMYQRSGGWGPWT
ncbi:MAG: hypothetical protein RJA49_672 [Actinomycetota bacterium]